MKRVLCYAIAAIVIVSCSKDKKEEEYTNPENLSGTIWKCYDGLDEDMEYAALKFISTSAIEGWTKFKSGTEVKDWTGSYTVNSNIITVNYINAFGNHSFAGAIDGETMNLAFENAGTLVFKKQ
jgi:hypothetical protein